MPYLLRAVHFVLICMTTVVLHAGDSGDAPKVAVLRLTDALNSSKSFLTRSEVHRQDRTNFQAKMKEFADTIQKLQNSIEALPRGSERSAQAQLELEATKANREAFAGWWEKELERRYMVLVQDEYLLMRETLAAFCKQRSIKIVVQSAAKEMGAPNSFALNLRLDGQTALYWDADQDITDAYVGFANQRWTERVDKDKAVPTTTPAPAPQPVAPQPNGAP
ncbi:MAG: hypothetical protein AAB263_00705 [Planctomycetota bacterium]